MKTYVVEAAVTYGVQLKIKAKSKEEARMVAVESILDGEGEAIEVFEWEIDDIRKEKADG